MPASSKGPLRSIDKSAKLRSHQRKHKEKIKHRIIGLETRLSGTERTLSQALAVISALSQELRSMPTHKRSNLSAQSPLASSEEAATTIRTQNPPDVSLTFPWESHANPEDYSWSSALSAGVRINELDMAQLDSSSTTSPAGSPSYPPSVVDNGSDTSSDCLSPSALHSPDSRFSHEAYDVFDIGAMRECLDPSLQKTFSRVGADQQGSASLFALMDFISR